mmetsp:Transcript_25988/g.37270  ORF Transcript_25988/g.37270 Transcript_25988/m.37270 type:complete len:835 (+) Transcript_25988:1356-3860(+)
MNNKLRCHGYGINISVFACLILIFIPFLFLFNHNLNNEQYDIVRRNVSMSGSIMANVLKNSEVLRIAHACCIAGVLPMAVDVAMDFYLKTTFKTISSQWNERFLYLFALLIPSVTFLVWGQSSYIPGIYITQLYAQCAFIGAVVLKSVLVEFQSKSKRILPTLLHISVYSNCLRCAFRSFEVLLDLNLMGFLASIMAIGTFISLSVGFIWWLYKTICIRSVDSSVTVVSFSYEEYQCGVCISAVLIYALVLFIVPSAKTWQDTEEYTLASYAYLQLAFAVAITVLPGRISRMQAALSMEMLNQRQILVRYVSHEIRSPLNVMHAGLQLLIDELRQHTDFLKCMELVEDILSASDSAISILDDLLSYEYLDAGSFKLDLSWKPLLRLFEEKLSWIELLVKSKDVHFSIVDESVTTQAGIAANTTPDSLDAFPFISAQLHVDICKIDQVVRNLVTNAIKFTPSGGQLEVKISCVKSDSSSHALWSSMESKDENIVGHLRVEVTDSGTGIAAEDQAHLFGEITQFDRNKLQGGGGSGLGLWISRRIIQMHQGRMGFLSAGKGQGSTFYFELPLYSHHSFDVVQLEGEGGVEAVKRTEVSSKTSFVSHTPRESGSVATFNSAWSSVYRSFNFGDDADSVVKFPSRHNSLLQPFRTRSFISFDRRRSSGGRRRSSGVAIHPTPDFFHGLDDVSEDGPPCIDEVAIARSQPLKILIADDSMLNRKIIRRIIQSDKDGFGDSDMIEVEDGTAAVEAVKQCRDVKPFDVIFMDYIMLDMNGPEAVEIIRNDLNYCGPIIGITGNALPTDIAKFIASGVNEVLTKPVTKAKLIETIQSYRTEK